MINTLSSTPLRLNQLQNISKTLKKEFYGIDEVIDRIINYLSAWYCLPRLQPQPVVINLWGLTGVGKTSLVTRIVELLKLEDRYSKFDFSDSSILRDFPEYLANLNDAEMRSDRVFLFDEFQHVNAKEDSRKMEKAMGSVGSFFDWLYTGQMDYVLPTHLYADMVKDLKRLRRALDLGAKIVDGVMVEGDDLYKSYSDVLHFFREDKRNENKTLPAINYTDLVNHIPNKEFRTTGEFIEASKKYSGEDLYEFLSEQLHKALLPSKLQIPHALVFIAGNLDEAFGPLVKSFDRETDVDSVHELTKSISISEVKLGLSERLRPEWLSRLGNNHVLYPSLSEKAYYTYIENRANYYTRQLKDQIGVSFEYKPSLLSIIYKEAVFPSQGIRPLESTIHSIFINNFTTLIPKLATEVKKGSKFYMEILDDGAFKLSLYYKGELIKEASDYFELSYLKKIKDKNINRTACVAVHEAGHAIVQVLLTRVLPKKITCKTTSDTVQGYVLNGPDKDSVFTKNYYLDRIALLYGGVEAERMVFGDDNASLGAVGDIRHATHLASTLVRESGLDQFDGYIDVLSSADTKSIKDAGNRTDDVISEVLRTQRNRASEVITEYAGMLADLSKELLHKGELKGQDIADFFSGYNLCPSFIHEMNHAESLEAFYQEYGPDPDLFDLTECA